MEMEKKKKGVKREEATCNGGLSGLSLKPGS
jgi:hypothetical protein